jgi:eukaryotic-like serine/threonine-protein kinase
LSRRGRPGGLGGLLGAGKEGLKGTSIPGTALPNQGIALSVRSALLRGLLVGGSFGLTMWLGFLRTAGPSGALNGALVVGLLFGTLAAVGGGLLDVVQHYTLRAVLAARGYAPLNYSRFLDYAARLVLLQRAGGGYLFIHRLLLEHFVAGKASWAGPRAPQVGPGDASAASVPPQIQAPTTTPAPQAASTAQMT